MRRHVSALAAFLGCLAFPLAVAGAPVVIDGQADFSTELHLVPGLQITFPIRHGINTRDKQIGDYDFNVNVTDASAGGLKFKWTMSEPAEAAGSRIVTGKDQKDSHCVSLFYHDKQNATIMGSTNIVRISDALYNGLVEGREVAFAIDGPDADTLSQAGVKHLPKSIHLAGEEYLDVWINQDKVPVRTLKAECDNGWTYWVLDNPQFPVMVAGAGPMYWQEPHFNNVAAEAAPATDEGRSVTKQLEQTGTASTNKILFAFDSAELTDESKRIIDSVGKYLAANSTIRMQVEGHTDNVGGLDYNMSLSSKRAHAVERYLTDHCGIAAGRLTSVGCGYSVPVADNGTPEGRAQNRRVVFKQVQ